MKTITFCKYQGAGNDFVLLDNRNGAIDPSNYTWFEKLCHRRFGIGADGVMLLQNKTGYDFEMLYYNADGRPSSMCGNGGRCIVSFAQHLGIITDQTHFIASDGEHTASLNKDGSWVSLQMIDVTQIGKDGEAYILYTGSPHYVLPVADVQQMNVFAQGKAIRNSATYAEKGINVNFVSPQETGYRVRTYERGVEDETLACGTGATAVALAMAYSKGLKGTIEMPIRVQGGNLLIRFHASENGFTEIFLEGPATLVFQGEIIIGE